MIDVDYNEYKATLEENMQLIQENHKLKEKINDIIKYVERVEMPEGYKKYILAELKEDDKNEIV